MPWLAVPASAGVAVAVDSTQAVSTFFGSTPGYFSVFQRLPLENLFNDGRTISLRPTITYDHRDNRLFPTSGHLESASAEFAASAFGSQNLFQRFRLIERYYHPLVWGLVFKVNLTLGYIRATEPIHHQIAISEKFFEGGINSIRGYVLRTISPLSRAEKYMPRGRRNSRW